MVEKFKPECSKQEKFKGEVIKEKVDKLEKIWEQNKERVFEFEKWDIEKELPFPEISPSLLEVVLNEFVKRFEKKEEYPRYLGAFISAFVNKNIDEYIEKELKEGKKMEEIEALKIKLNVENLKEPLSYLGWKNREKCWLIIEGNCGDYIGWKMSGGKIEIHGNCERFTGMEISGGQLEVKGNCGNFTGYGMSGGTIEVQRNCEDGTGWGMSGGTLIINGEVKGFDKSVFSEKNKGTIVHKGKKIWPK